ncbi:MAG: glycoside hydrolase family 3 protein, partial [Candidatus Krumholzibacteriota bacterium]|nr:glycoside hydrolase family 3 protein [Candidatus Krumholzibacteriota bacterium]
MKEDILKSIALRLVVGLEGTSLSGRERDLLSEYPPAGIILFARNVQTKVQLTDLISAVRAIIADASGLVPLIMADHEGGRISVLARAVGVPPPPLASWNDRDIDVLREVYLETSRRVRACGINMILGPLADINSEPLNPVIGTRAFGETAAVVAPAVGESVRALAEGGILSCLKHFPGHGSTLTDSHLELPLLDKSLEELKAEELIPFRQGISAGADSVMIAHIATRGRPLPASLDRGVIAQLLREECGFGGVVITDALEMAGVLTGRGEPPGQRSEKYPGGSDRYGGSGGGPVSVIGPALEAGNDLLLFCRPAEI